MQVTENIIWASSAHQLYIVSLDTRVDKGCGSRCVEKLHGQIFGQETQAGDKKADSIFQRSDDICQHDDDPAASSLEGSKVLREGGALFPKVKDAANQRALWE